MQFSISESFHSFTASSLTLVIVSILVTESDCDGFQRWKRQEEEIVIEEDVIGQICDFGTATLINSCSWTVPNNSHPTVRWRVAQGSQEFWLGGPGRDHTLLDTSGGYAYFETSYQQPQQSPFSSGRWSQDNGNLKQSNGSGVYSSGHGIKNNRHPSPSYSSSSSSSSKSDEIIRPLITNFPLFQIDKEFSRNKIPVPDFSLFQSVNISDTGPQGLCMSFFYIIDGLSTDSLQVLLMDMKSNYNRTLIEFNDITDEQWKKSEILYTYADVHKIAFKANAKKLSDPERSFRGYIAIDDIEFKQIEPKILNKEVESCKGHCTFEAGLCAWSNQDDDDDFDWKVGRGSQNLFTGPTRDFSSFGNNEISGGYVYIDSAYPRRPGDRAQLLSPIMNPTSDNMPLCLKFAVHMYGNGVGSLRVLIRYASGDETIPDQLLWEMSGESGNSWHVAQVPISSPVLSYQIVFEGEIGSNSLGVIALDNIAFNEDECPDRIQREWRCTFDENMCFWTNPGPFHRLDDFDWLRQFSLGTIEPRYDHTKRSTEGYFINLSGDQPHRGGTRAWLLSPEFVPQSTVPKCMTFQYYMFERTIDSAGPSLGSLRIYVKTITDNGDEVSLIWRLNNHQGQVSQFSMRSKSVSLIIEILNNSNRDGGKLKIPILIGQDLQPPLQNYQIIIEGIWGDGRVGTIALDDITYPPKAMAVFGECAFDRDLCGYRNQSGKAQSANNLPSKATHLERNKNPNRISISKDSITWKLATATNRPANLQDHTFRAPSKIFSNIQIDLKILIENYFCMIVSVTI
ncbi:MAM and LDL-receptor class A domain-containing protein 1 [Sarcoptes scabiei]|uniref:MAM and LDL-receptor class A domain-containing protein 1 n=1 Tax=Sarcoptes scabiei TaxID=52283 RepID=A0A834RGN5_SARSC|nr:MAM and LDL-receptor class A domain-containing protein 1 [Sarcoptes scabiei]